jgi:hypothetical protein
LQDVQRVQARALPGSGKSALLDHASADMPMFLARRLDQEGMRAALARSGTPALLRERYEGSRATPYPHLCCSGP